MHPRRLVLVSLAATLALGAPSAARATPTTDFWTPATPAVQPYGVLHLGDDVSFGADALYPVDLGLTVGVLPTRRVQLELGVDVVYPTFGPSGPLVAPVSFNAKLALPEGAWFAHQPGLAVGVYGLGLAADVTTYDVFTVVAGVTLPRVGALAVGGDAGLSRTLLVDPAGAPARAGVMAGWASPSIATRWLDHVAFTADVQTGHNALAAAGGGVALYVTPAASVLTGPVVFLEPALQPGGDRWMWSVQVDVDVDLGSR